MSFLDLQDKTFVVFGIANKRSVAYCIARALLNEGAKVIETRRAVNFPFDVFGVLKFRAEGARLRFAF